MRSLVVVAGTDAARARRLAGEDVALVAWDSRAAEALGRAGIGHRLLSDWVDAAGRERAAEAAIAWTKEWGRRPVLDGKPFRDLLEWKGVSLWWFAELYLHHCTEAPRFVRLVETFHRLLEATAPEEVEAVGLPPAEALLLARTCTARRVLFHGPAGRPRRRGVLAVSLRSRWNTVKTFLGAGKAALLGPPRPRGEKERALFLSHAAFWRTRAGTAGTEEWYEHYFDRLIPEVAARGILEPLVVAVGPRAAFRRRGAGSRLRDWLALPGAGGPYVPINRHASFAAFGAVRRATAEIRRLWRRLRKSPGLRQAFSHRGVGFADLAEEAFAGTMLLQLPWAVRSFEEVSATLAAARPAVLCLYAESSGWGRAALAACRAAGVPTVAMQHGILYPGYYSYLHAEDEGDCPRPDRTAVFGEAARRFLVEEGRYAPGSLVVTGSPRFDALVEASSRWDRQALRARHGVGEDERLLVVASRFRPITETHEAIGAEFPALVRAVEALPGVRCLVKPHPAEPASPYAQEVRRQASARVAVLPGSASLLELLHAADALVTVESLSAVEALVLGRPVVVLSMPSHLRALVDAGAALGVVAGGDPAPALRSVLFDEETRRRLEAARQAYVSDVAQGVDGGATARILDLVHASARRGENRPPAGA